MQLTRQQFTDYIQALRAADELDDLFYKTGIEIHDSKKDIIGLPAKILYSAVFNSDQRFNIEWWLYDRGGIESDPAMAEIMNADGEPIANLDSIDKLYDYLEDLD